MAAYVVPTVDGFVFTLGMSPLASSHLCEYRVRASFVVREASTTGTGTLMVLESNGYDSSSLFCSLFWMVKSFGEDCSAQT